MARIYPREFPAEAAQNPLRRAEKQFYEVLRDHLASEWIVFYSIPWTAPRGPNGALRDGEADFVIVHPRRGWLVLELKGGRVGLDSETMAWWQDTPSGRKSIAPFEQARRGMYELRETLEAIPRDGALVRALTFGYGVVFPDALLSPEIAAGLPPYVRREMISDCTVTPEQTESWLDKLLAAFGGSGGLSEPPLTREQGQRVAALMQERLAPRLALSTPLSVRLGLVEDRLLEMTSQQAATLQAMGVHRRLAVSGCAGSGKTMLAIEKARALAREGFRTLVVCHSPPLAAHLAEALAAETAPPVSESGTNDISGGVVVRAYEALVRELASAAGLSPLPTAVTGDRDVLAERLVEALSGLKSAPYDAVLVDEGQDFTESEWVALSYLATSKSSVFYVFYDNNQRLGESDSGNDDAPRDTLPDRLQLMQWPLTQNVRNSVPVFEAVKGLYDAPLGLFSYGPQGPAVSYVETPDESDLKKALRSRLHILLYDERVPPERIVVLTPRPLTDSALPDTWAQLPAPQNAVRYFDIASFKGLEASVVIVVELDALFEEDPRRVELAYVGLSRARGQLILMGETETLQAIRNGLR